MFCLKAILFSVPLKQLTDVWIAGLLAIFRCGMKNNPFLLQMSTLCHYLLTSDSNNETLKQDNGQYHCLTEVTSSHFM